MGASGPGVGNLAAWYHSGFCCFLMNNLNFQGSYVRSLAPHSVADLGPRRAAPRALPRGPGRGKDVPVGGVQVGSRGLVSFWTWPALVAACARGRLRALVLVPGFGAGARHSWCIVARMRKLPSRLATVTLA